MGELVAEDLKVIGNNIILLDGDHVGSGSGKFLPIAGVKPDKGGSEKANRPEWVMEEIALSLGKATFGMPKDEKSPVTFNFGYLDSATMKVNRQRPVGSVVVRKTDQGAIDFILSFEVPTELLDKYAELIRLSFVFLECGDMASAAHERFDVHSSFDPHGQAKTEWSDEAREIMGKVWIGRVITPADNPGTLLDPDLGPNTSWHIGIKS